MQLDTWVLNVSTKFGIVGMFQIHFIGAASARLAYLSQQLLGGVVNIFHKTIGTISWVGRLGSLLQSRAVSA